MRDGLVRVVLKAIARTLGAFELRVTRALLSRRGEPRYRLTGSCNGCGKCCERPSIQAGVLLWRLPVLRALTLWWQRVVNGFELVETDPRFKLFVFRCSHYDPVTKRCDSYESRPLMCRDYPVNLTFEAVPPLFSECSHGVVDRNAAQLRAALIAAGVTGDKLKEAEARLFLTEPPKDPP